MYILNEIQLQSQIHLFVFIFQVEQFLQPNFYLFNFIILILKNF